MKEDLAVLSETLETIKRTTSTKAQKKVAKVKQTLNKKNDKISNETAKFYNSKQKVPKEKVTENA